MSSGYKPDYWDGVRTGENDGEADAIMGDIRAEDDAYYRGRVDGVALARTTPTPQAGELPALLTDDEIEQQILLVWGSTGHWSSRLKFARVIETKVRQAIAAALAREPQQPTVHSGISVSPPAAALGHAEGGWFNPMTNEFERHPEPPIIWPKEKSVKRRDDMSPSDALQVGIDESGDLQVSLWTEKAGYSSVEFCAPGSGGGRSPYTRRALIALMVAMEADAAPKAPTSGSDLNEGTTK